MISGLALAPLLALAACGRPSTADQPAATVVSVAETAAQVGTIASVLSYSGSVSPAWTVSVLPQVSGQVTDLKVRPGQKVGQGDVIAMLDHRAQDDQVSQAQANLASSQAKLNAVLNGARAEDVAAANATAAGGQAAVVQAQANLESAKQKLSAAQAGGRSESVAQAQAKLNADQAALAKLQNGAVPQDVANAQLAVEQAKDKLYADQTQDDAQVSRGQMTKEQRQAALDVDQTGIDQANTQLAKIAAPPRAEDVAQAKAAIDSDKPALALAQQPNRPEDIAQLQQSVAAAQAQVDQAQQQANAQKANAAKAAKPYTSDDVAQAKAAVDVSQASVQSAQTALTNLTVIAPAAAVVT
jgi:HlyD family secretion protein